MIISGLQAKAKDRQWLKNQTSGELDDTKLIEGKKKSQFIISIYIIFISNAIFVPSDSRLILCL